MKPVFALVDCNNFYASCEKLFRPDLQHQPVIVLSNNDGCVVARSREAKALGIKMGVPVFQIEQTLRHHNVHTFSSNYALYADISQRVMQTLDTLAPRIEVYSIDEAFLDLTGVEASVSLLEFGQQVRQTIHRWVGIQVCVGIAPTKTLAKLANHAAKHYSATGGVVDLTSPMRQRKLMSLLPVSEVWGIGRKLSKRLMDMGIQTALDLANASPKMIRRQFSIVVERTICELNGESCLALESISPTKQQIICSRSFGQRITDYDDMRQAVSEYTARASEKLRSERQQAKVLNVFLRTSPFSQGQPFYSNAATGELSIPSADTRDLLCLAMHLLKRIWREGYPYAKAGVMLTDFYDPGTFQMNLFDSNTAHPNSQALMQVMDHINHSGRGRVFFAGQGTQKNGHMKRQQLSPAYTTRWSDLARVK